MKVLALTTLLMLVGCVDARRAVAVDDCVTEADGSTATTSQPLEVLTAELEIVFDEALGGRTCRSIEPGGACGFPLDEYCNGALAAVVGVEQPLAIVLRGRSRDSVDIDDVVLASDCGWRLDAAPGFDNGFTLTGGQEHVLQVPFLGTAPGACAATLTIARADSAPIVLDLTANVVAP